jgi:pyruvate dehydrogenase E1 component
VEQSLGGRKGPVIAATDYIKLHADSIRGFLPKRYRVLGTDGFGRSDTRARLRHFFEVNRYWIAVHALKTLAEEGELPPAKAEEAMKKYGLDVEKPNPVTV